MGGGSGGSGKGRPPDLAGPNRPKTCGFWPLLPRFFGKVVKNDLLADFWLVLSFLAFTDPKLVKLTAKNVQRRAIGLWWPHFLQEGGNLPMFRVNWSSDLRLEFLPTPISSFAAEKFSGFLKIPVKFR